MSGVVYLTKTLTKKTYFLVQFSITHVDSQEKGKQNLLAKLILLQFLNNFVSMHYRKTIGDKSSNVRVASRTYLLYCLISFYNSNLNYVKLSLCYYAQFYQHFQHSLTLTHASV